MTQPGREPTTYCVRGGHANLYGNKPSRRVSSVSPFTYEITNLHMFTCGFSIFVIYGKDTTLKFQNNFKGLDPRHANDTDL